MARTEIFNLHNAAEPQPGLIRRAWDAVTRSLHIGPRDLKDRELVRLFGGGPTASGVAVNERTIQGRSGVWAGLNLVASQIAAVPIGVYERSRDGGRERQYDQLHRVLNVQFNPEMSAVTGRTLMLRHALLHGVAYAEIERDQAYRVAAIWPLQPGSVAPVRDESGRLSYRVSGIQRDITFSPADLLILLGPASEDGIHPEGMARHGRESLGAGLAAERYAARFYGHGTSPSGFLRHPGKLGPDALENLRDSLAARYEGVENSHRFLVLEENMEFVATSIDAEKSQLRGSRDVAIEEDARWLGISPTKIGDLSHATYSNIEHAQIAHNTDTVLPWTRRWECEMNCKFFSPQVQMRRYVEHLLEGIMRADSASRAAFYQIMLRTGAITPNEIRRRENLNPIEGGDQALVSRDLVPLAQLGSLANPIDDDEVERYVDRRLAVR
jgi:HK97 family phage portal protein